MGKHLLLKAADLDEAYDKIVERARLSTDPYRNVQGVDVQWVFEGVTEILPVYEEIEDGCEIIWSEYTKKLKNNSQACAGKGRISSVSSLSGSSFRIIMIVGMAASAKAVGPATRKAREEVKSSIWLSIGVSTLSPVPSR